MARLVLWGNTSYFYNTEIRHAEVKQLFRGQANTRYVLALENFKLFLQL